MDCNEVKKVNDCWDIATVDAYDEYEIASGWFECLTEVFDDIENVKLFGEKIEFCGVDFFRDHDIVAVCKKKRKKVRVTPDSIELINPTKSQKIWMKAWTEWVQ